MDAEPTPGATPTEPLVVGDHVVVTGNQPIDIGQGQTAPLALLLTHHNQHCRYCTEGWVRRIEGGKPITKVCACCVDRLRKHLAAEARAARAATAIGVAPLPSAIEEERTKRRIERLARDVSTLEAELRARAAKFADATLDLGFASARHCAEAEQHANEIASTERHCARVREDMDALEERLKGLAAALRSATEDMVLVKAAHAIAAAMATDAKTELERRGERFEESVRGLRRELDRALRRLARARAYNGLAAGEPAAEEEAAPHV